MGGSSATVGVVGSVSGTAHQAAVATVDQTQIITLQVTVQSLFPKESGHRSLDQG